MKPIVSAAIQYLFMKLEGNMIFVAVMPYTKGYGTEGARTKTHLPVETVDPGKKIGQELKRGAIDEAAKDRTKFKFRVGNRFHAVLCPDQKYLGCLHLKVAYEMTVTEGELRDFEQLDTQDADEMHGPLEYREVRDILECNDPTRPELLNAHAKTITSYIRYMANTDEGIAWEYSDILNLYEGDELDKEEVAAIERYIATH